MPATPYCRVEKLRDFTWPLSLIHISSTLPWRPCLPRRSSAFIRKFPFPSCSADSEETALYSEPALPIPHAVSFFLAFLRKRFAGLRRRRRAGRRTVDESNVHCVPFPALRKTALRFLAPPLSVKTRFAGLLIELRHGTEDGGRGTRNAWHLCPECGTTISNDRNRQGGGLSLIHIWTPSGPKAWR